MRNYLFIFTFLLSLLTGTIQAQVSKVIVETYYVSDNNDGTDTIGGKLETGSKTYRVYIELKNGSKLKKIYGDAKHALKFASTAPFFNNLDRGQTFAKDFSKNHYRENTVGLDTWLTLGQTTKTAAKTYCGVLKSEDKDASFIGGSNNDGGSAELPNGLLNNADTSAGIPINTQDGFTVLTTIPSDWADYGIRDLISGDDSTIFGSLVAGNKFISYNAGVQNSGVTGIENKVLIGQFTTKGVFSFELNLEIIDSAGTTTHYVANDSILLAGEVLERYLTYPFIEECGCPDKNYLEYKKDRDCDDKTACKSEIVFGCMDPLSCTYNSKANFNLTDLCCYPGYCNDRDLSVVCPDLGESQVTSLEFTIYPNPAENSLTIQVDKPENKDITYTIYDCFGTELPGKSGAPISDAIARQIDLSSLPQGLYLIRLFRDGTIASKRFMKQ